MSTPGGTRTLASLVDEEAPLAPRRAASVMLAVCAELGRIGAAGSPGGVTAADIHLCADGSVRIDMSCIAAGTSAGSSTGRLLFELLVGRPPVGADDAFEPHLQTSLGPAGVALLARSCSDSPGQWPDLDDWSATLRALAGGQAAPTPPHRAAAERRRHVAIVIAVVILVAISAAVVLLAPRWWDTAVREESGIPATHRTPRPTSMG